MQRRSHALCLWTILIAWHPLNASACALDDAELLYSRATEQLFLYEFWTDVDEREARTALDKAIVQLDTIRSILGRSDCLTRDAARNLARIVGSGLDRYRQESERGRSRVANSGPR